ncbi:hypothetical protein GCM10022215_06180 [Nocardioides fonticola]|uniref:DUF2087 domain-containing protein n=1 Tax=Nocardioides fonticola TaxID=450363 RepID=A0ABP7XC35_9ACTN
MDPETSCVSTEGRRVLGHFLDADGRLHTIPTRRAKRLVVLDHLAQRFDLGRTYLEREVVEILSAVHPDHAALRRYLVEEQFLTREDSVYWRSGGTVVV